MIDNFGREINYLRISLTQKCNLNCIYCGCDTPDADELSADEILKIVRVFADLGITKVRLTGGEPLLRKDITEIASSIKKTKGIKKLVITTNGILLSGKASELKKAGVDAVNISLDTLDNDNYKMITGRNLLLNVLEGIDAALSSDFDSVRLNSVLIRGKNDEQAEKLIGIAKDKKLDVRFIELMPFSDEGENKELVIKKEEILSKFPFLYPCEKEEPSVATYFTAKGFVGRVGFISPVSEKFCSRCNRIRLLSDGKLKPCLGHNETISLKEYLDDEEKLKEVIKKTILGKPKGHNFECAYGNLHAMNKIGG